jgi:anti-anti-sigma regulatory factor
MSYTNDISNTKDISNCFNSFSVRTYKGKDELYGIIQLEKPDTMIDVKASSALKDDFKRYFNDGFHLPLKEEGVTKYAIHMGNIPAIKPDGMAALLVSNRQSNNNGYGFISLIGCNEKVTDAFSVTQLDTVFRMVDKETDL